MADRYYAIETSATDDLLLEDGSGKYLLEVIENTLPRTITVTKSINAVIGETMAIITMTRGDSLDIAYTIRDQDGALVDLTGGSISWKALVSGTTTAVITKSGVLTDPSNGVTTVSLDPADTTSLGGTYAVEAKFTDTGAEVYTFDDGSLRVEIDDTD